jgi:hypothetical protein
MNMNKSLVPAKPIEMPKEFERFFDLPAMVGEEKHRDYFDFFSAIADAIKPTDLLDWIWISDFVEAEWDIRRNRRIKVETIKLKVANIEVANIEDPYLLAKVFVKYGKEIDPIDRRIAAGEKKRDGILREIYRRRESLARKLEKACSDIIDAEFTEAAE